MVADDECDKLSCAPPTQYKAILCTTKVVTIFCVCALFTEISRGEIGVIPTVSSRGPCILVAESWKSTKKSPRNRKKYRKCGRKVGNAILESCELDFVSQKYPQKTTKM